MNGNDLNNMAKRYKEEMMKLYRKSGQTSACASAETGNTGMGAGMRGNTEAPSSASSSMAMNEMNMGNGSEQEMSGQSPRSMEGAARSMGGVPQSMGGFFSAPGTNPSAAHSHMGDHGGHSAGRPGGGMGNDRPRPPMPPMQGNPSPDRTVECECRFPSAESIINSIANTPMPLPITPADDPRPVAPAENNSPIQPRGGAAISRNPADSENNMTDMKLKSIILNAAPEDPNYAVPSQNEDRREIMPDFSMPSDLSADADGEVPQIADLTPSRSWASLTGDDTWGFLQVQVYTSEGDFPIEGAMVIVRKRINAGVGLSRVLMTNANGFTPTIALPAPGNMYAPSESSRPFSEYEITVVARGYYVLRNIGTAVFAMSKTVQPVDMIPLPEYPAYPVYPPQPRSGEGVSVG